MIHNPSLLIWVAAGGAIGAVGRYLVMIQVGHWLGNSFPYPTLAVNVIGSFVLGVLIEALALAWQPGEGLRVMLTVGVLGAFTTFSTFSMEVVLLAQRHEVANAAIYIAVSVVCSVAALFAGLRLMRWVL